MCGWRSGKPDAAVGAPAAPATVCAVSMCWSRVGSAFGRRGTLRADSQGYRFGMPRSDLRVTAARVDLSPPCALGSWLAFKAHGDGAVAMGNLMFSKWEPALVVARLQAGGVEQTTIHHHIVQETPRMLYVHIRAHGDPVTIAATGGHSPRRGRRRRLRPPRRRLRPRSGAIPRPSPRRWGMSTGSTSASGR